MFKAAALLVPLLLSSSIGAQDTIADKIRNLRVTPANADRVKILNDNDFVFDFLHATSGESDGAGGHTVAASSSNMPALIGNGMAMTIGFLGPCGFNTPHTHPRATEFNFAVNGTLQTGFLAENGARFVFNEVPPGSAAIFPKGAIHFEMNNGCEDMLFVAAFNDEDPGVDQIAQRFFGLPPSFIAASLGDIGVEQVAGLEAKIPNNIALGTDECLKRCGLSRTDQPTSQRQPRVQANALPNGFSGPPAPAATPAPTPASGSDKHEPATSRELQSPTGVTGGAAISLNDSDGKPNPLIIALIVLTSLMAIGYVALAVGFILRRNREKKTRSMGAKYFRTGAQFAPQGRGLAQTADMQVSSSVPEKHHD
ncbi:RmlC-like cupin [Panus rudis PR-1116 ss-1]|nr:RmlC-like cupin [Panus rudis PR-1116 ss-1]